MQKSLSEMAGFMQKLLPPEMPDLFGIDPCFLCVSDEDNIRNGIHGFRDFMYRIYDRLMTSGESYDKPRKEAHEFADGVNISEAYPFMSNIAVILTNMGVHGIFNDTGDTLLLEGIECLTASNAVSNTKISDVRKLECLRFLMDCGMCFGGIDISGKKPVLTSVPMAVSFPENPVMLTGMKVMALAQQNLANKFIADIILRCDYRVLAKKEIEILLLLKDLLHHQPENLRKFVLKLHSDYIALGYKFESRVSNNVIFTYFCRRKELWRLNLSINNGLNITIKALNTEKYPDMIATFPKWLQDKIAVGYGCGKKMGITSSCDGGCRGYRIPLDDASMETCGVINEWINKEVSCIQK